jgi:hypothetical protein
LLRQIGKSAGLRLGPGQAAVMLANCATFFKIMAPAFRFMFR